MKRLIVLCLTFFMFLGLCGCTTATTDSETKEDEVVLDGTTSDSGSTTATGSLWDKNAAANKAYAPKVVTLENGVKIQKTPADKTALDVQAGDVESKTVSCWNNYFLNADNRGCTACHTIENALEMMETYHGIIYFGYDVEQGLQNCFGCHSFYDNRMRDAIHTVHQRSDTFESMGGSCESCHYINRKDDGTIEYQRWDYVKYDVLRGIESVAADNADIKFEWNQTEVTPREKMYYKSVKSNPTEWITTDDQTSEDAFNNWKIKFTGAIDKECTMTLKELIDKYGTETRLMKSHCTVNGPGQGMIYQAKVTGIPVNKIMKDLGVHKDAVICNPIAIDGYSYPVATKLLETEEALLVVGMNGDTIYAEQGWPVALWFNELSAGNFIKQVAEVNFATDGASWDFYGDFTDATTGLQFDKPNVGVLTAREGQIFEAGKAVHLEGFADAWNEPITKIEFSLDNGATWKAFNTDKANTTQWVYWKADFSNLEKGSYVLKIRVTSKMSNGKTRTNDVENQMTNFMFNVQ